MTSRKKVPGSSFGHVSSPHGRDASAHQICANSSIQFRVIDLLRNPRWRPPPPWVLKSCKFGTFRHVNSVVLELYIKFGSYICYSHWESTYLISRRSFDDVSRINFRCRLLVMWSSPMENQLVESVTKFTYLGSDVVSGSSSTPDP